MTRLLVIFLLTLPMYAYSEVILDKNNVVVTEEDIERYIETRLPENDRLRIVARPGFLKETIENIYSIRKLAAQARNNKRLDQGLVQWTTQMESDRVYMKAQMQDIADQQIEKVNWEARAKETYLAESDRFKKQESVHAAHVLIKPEGRSDEAAFALAKEIRTKALNGDNFTDLAIAFSEDKSVKRNSGDLGQFNRGRMVKEFEDAVFSLANPGDISDVVKTQFGYHVIKLIDKTAGSKSTFEEVKDQIIDELQAADEKLILGNLVTSMRTEAISGINSKAMEKLISKYGAQLEEAGLLETMNTSE